MIEWYLSIISSIHSSFLGHSFAKVPNTSETSELWEVLLLKYFYSCENVLHPCSFSSWHELLGLDCHIHPSLILLSIELLRTCKYPYERFLLEKIPWMKDSHELGDPSRLSILLLFLRHCFQWLLVAPWYERPLWSGIECFLTSTCSHPWFEFSRSSSF